MGTLAETLVWPAGVRYFEANAILTGGPDCPDNLPLQDLTNRTAFLKKQIDDAVSGALTFEYANRLKTVRSIAMTGDGSWVVTFDGSGNVTAAMTLANTGVAAGTYPVVTIDSKGRVTAARALQSADLPANAALTGSPTAPTAAPGTNTLQIANTAYVQAAIAALVASSPAALDTLNELAAALGNDPNFATTITNALAGKAASVHTHAIADVVGLQAALDGKLSALPAGIPLDWSGLMPPIWAVVRDGSALSRASYASLFAALCPQRNGTLTNGANTVTGLSTTLDMWVGMPVEGAGVPAGATIASITSSSAITLSANATASGVQSLRLFPFGYGSGGSATTFGVPDDRGLHTRAYDSGRGYEQSTLTANTTNASNVLTGISSTRGLYVGMPVSGAGIPASTTISEIVSAVSVKLSANATATASAVALTVTGRQVGAEGMDEIKSHNHLQVYDLTGAGGGSGGLVGTTITSNSVTRNTGGPENNVKRRIYLPIITLGA